MTIKSPFPGVDPYLQKHWADVHHRFIQYSCDAMQGERPDGLMSRVETRVFVEEFERIRSIAPGTRILEWRSANGHHALEEADGSIATAESRVFLFEADETTEGFIEIREADGGKVVTIIEFHSPANKAGGVETYLQKQSHVMQSETSLVEIDLIRGGQRVLAMSDAPIPAEWANGSLALARKGWEGRQFTLYHMPLRKHLSPLPIPLRYGEKPVVLDLKPFMMNATVRDATPH